MTRARRICETIHLASLGVWVGAAMMTGAMAAIVFPAVRELDPTAPLYTLYGGAHWSLIAGKVMAPVFMVLDVVQLLMAFGAFGAFIAMLAMRRIRLRRPLPIARFLLLIGLVVSLGALLLFVSPRMNANLVGYWTAAELGQNQRAAELKAAFDADHPRASLLLKINTLLALAALVTGLWSAMGASGSDAAGDEKSRDSGGSKSSPPRYEEPLLASKIS